MMNRSRGLAAVAVMALVSSGCLLKDTISTWYLDQDGRVTWSVIEKDVRSDATSGVESQNEEFAYITAVRAQNHPMARGLNELAPLELKTQIVHATAPFTVNTEARYERIDRLGTMLIARLGLVGSSLVTRDLEGTTWTFTVQDPNVATSAPEPDDDLSGLADTMEALKVVLRDGRFVSAEGFDLSRDRRVATIRDNEDQVRANGTLTLTLKWKLP